MSFLAGFEIASSGLSAQRTRLNVVSSNRERRDDAHGRGGIPPRDPVFRTADVDGFATSMRDAVQAVQVEIAVEGDRAPAPL